MFYTNSILGVKKTDTKPETIKEGAEDLDIDMEAIPMIECADEPIEAFLRVALENEQNFNNIRNAIALDELVTLESTGEEMVYEESKFDSIKEKIIKVLNAFMGKIKGIFAKIYDVIDSYILQNKTFLENNKKKVAELKDKKVTITAYTFDGMDPEIFRDITDSYNTKFKKYLAVCSPSDVNTASKEELQSTIADFSSNKKSIMDSVRGDILGRDAVSNESFAVAFLNKLKGPAPERTIDAAFAITNLENLKKSKAEAKAIYKIVETSLRKKLSEANKIKFNKDDSKGVRIAALNVYTEIVKSELTTLSIAMPQYTKAILAQNTLYRAVVIKALKEGKKEEPAKDAVGESSLQTPSSSYLESIEII